MVIRLTNREPVKAIFFIDSSSKYLRLLTCAVHSGKDWVSDLKIKVVLYEKTGNGYYEADEIVLAEFKPSSKLAGDLYISKKYKITNKYERVSFSVDSKRPFDIELKLIID